MTYLEKIVDGMVRWAISEMDVQAIWLEGSLPVDIRRPYETLDVHVAVDEPCFSRILTTLPSVLADLTGASIEEATDTPCRAKLLRVTDSGASWPLILERTSMLAKRPRAHVATLLDRTGHLTQVMDTSLRRSTV